MNMLSIQILLIFTVTNWLKTSWLFFIVPCPKSFFWVEGNCFPVVSFYSLIPASWLTKSEYEPTGLLYGLKTCLDILKAFATSSCFKGETVCIRNLYSIFAEVSSGSHDSDFGLYAEQKFEFSLKMTKSTMKKLGLLLRSWFRLKLSGQKEFYDLWSVLNRDVFKHRIEFQDLRGKNKEQEGMKKGEMCHIHDCCKVLQKQNK